MFCRNGWKLDILIILCLMPSSATCKHFLARKQWKAPRMLGCYADEGYVFIVNTATLWQEIPWFWQCQNHISVWYSQGWNAMSVSPTLLGFYPDSKVHGTNMGRIWGRQDPGGPHVVPMNFAVWVRLILTSHETSYRKMLSSFEAAI